MIRAASTPRYSDDRQQKLEALARGRCSAAQRTIGIGPRYFPTIDGEWINDPEFAEGFLVFASALFAARKFRIQCQQQLAEANGSA
jgi:hypothetical protein